MKLLMTRKVVSIMNSITHTFASVSSHGGTQRLRNHLLGYEKKWLQVTEGEN